MKGKAGVKCRLMTTAAEERGLGGMCWWRLPQSADSQSHQLSVPNEDGPFSQHESDADEDERPVSTGMFSNDMA